MTKSALNPDILRIKAEEKLVSLQKGKNAQKFPSAEELAHELTVHQIELEMQNEELRRSQIELEEARDQFLNYYDFAPIGYLSLDVSGMISQVNLVCAKLLGKERHKLVNCHFANFVATEDRDHWHQCFGRALKQEERYSFEVNLRHNDGTNFNSRMECLRLLRGSKVKELRITLDNVTERNEVDQAVRQQEEFFRLIAENTDDLIAILDLNGKRLYNSPSYTKLFGNVDALSGTDSFAEIHPDDQEYIKRVFKETVETGIGIKAEFRFVLPDGSIRHMESRGGLIRDEHSQKQRVFVVSRDVTERKLAEENTNYMAYHDELTLLPNRRLLGDRIEQAISASKRTGRYGAVLFLDLDNFKPVNDSHGHEAGDLLLVEVARRLVHCVREMDTVARFGGDEFVVVLSELNESKSACKEEAEIVAEKIRNTLSLPYWLTSNFAGSSKMILQQNVGVSIGVALFNKEFRSEKVIKYADKAMYQAKEAGRNSIRFYDATISP